MKKKILDIYKLNLFYLICISINITLLFVVSKTSPDTSRIVDEQWRFTLGPQSFTFFTFLLTILIIIINNIFCSMRFPFIFKDKLSAKNQLNIFLSRFSLIISLYLILVVLLSYITVFFVESLILLFWLREYVGLVLFLFLIEFLVISIVRDKNM